MKSEFTQLFLILLLIPRIRTIFCKLRWKLLKSNLIFYNNSSSAVGENVVSYNLTAFDSDAAFGCGNRMESLLFPLRALIKAPKDSKILILGPRTEDDIYLSKALGFNNSTGLDLFSYSPYVDVGDMHSLPYLPSEFDAVIIGWTLVYSSDPQKVLEQCKQVLKPNGFLAIGWEWVPEVGRKKSNICGSELYDIEELIDMVKWPVVFLDDPSIVLNHHKSIIFKNNNLCP